MREPIDEIDEAGVIICGGVIMVSNSGTAQEAGGVTGYATGEYAGREGEREGGGVDHWGGLIGSAEAVRYV